MKSAEKFHFKPYWSEKNKKNSKNSLHLGPILSSVKKREKFGKMFFWSAFGSGKIPAGKTPELNQMCF